MLKQLFPAVLILIGSLNICGQDRHIRIDFNRSSGPMNTMFKECIGAGRANEGLRADWQQQLAMARKDCGFKYIRMHGLLTDDMAVYREDENGNPQYNYQYVDVLFDYLQRIGMKPFVELGFMPASLASGPGVHGRWYSLYQRVLLAMALKRSRMS